MDHNTQIDTTGNYLPAGNAPHTLHSTKSKMQMAAREIPQHAWTSPLLAHTGTDERTRHCDKFINVFMQSNCLLNMDLCAPFETVDHHILAERRQQQVGMYGSDLRWFSSYFSDRNFSVSVAISCPPQKLYIVLGLGFGPLYNSVCLIYGSSWTNNKAFKRHLLSLSGRWYSVIRLF